MRLTQSNQRGVGAQLVATAALACLTALGCSHRDKLPEARLEFTVRGHAPRSLSAQALAKTAAPRNVTVYDPEYGKTKHFRALPLAGVLEAGFRETTQALRGHEFVLHARDGYTVPVSGERLMEAGGFVAFEDLDVPGWEPLGREKVNPGPFYVVWQKPSQNDDNAYPRPWQLTAIEQAPFESVFPHTVPTGEPAGSPAMRGFALFRRDCIRCHAVNREGGSVGPDLNVPQSIVEYRPEAQIRAYIRNPLTFRYSHMPPHPDLRDADLDALIAYFRAMSHRKYDPRPPGR
jgi:mono/diheme cytochrome c family protein